MTKKCYRLFASSAVLVIIVFLASSAGTRDHKSQGRLGRPLTAASDQFLPQALSSSLWARSYGLFYGGPASSYYYEEDDPVAVQSLGNGKLAVAGYAVATGQDGVFHKTAVVMALNASGEVRWKTLYPYDPMGSTWTFINAVTGTPEGGLLAVGGYDGTRDGAVISYATVTDLDRDGHVCWMKGYKFGDAYVGGDAVVRARDGGYVVAGVTGYGAWVFKLDRSGAVIWSKVFTSPDLAYVNAIQETPDGGFFVAGNSGWGGRCQCETEWAWVMKLSASGGLIWHKSLSAEPANDYSRTGLTSIVATRDGGVALAGFISPVGPTWSSKTWACKLDSLGKILWSQTYNGQFGYSIIQASDGGLLMTGGASSARAFKLTANGDVQWAKKYERPFYGYEMADAFEKDGGGYIMVANCQPINLTPSFLYYPWVVMSVDKNGDIAPGCPFVRSITGDVRKASVHVVSESFSAVSQDYQVSTLAFATQTWPPVRVGRNACSR